MKVGTNPQGAPCGLVHTFYDCAYSLSPHQLDELGAAEAQRETPWCLTIIPLPIGISAMREKPCYRFNSYRGVSQQYTPVKERTAVRLAGEIHIDAALQCHLRQFNSYL